SSDFESLEFCLKERGVETWIRASAISSGMRRTLNHLVDIFLAPPGAVVIIDEFENSLGKNCMPALTDFIRSRAPDLQFLITSHHPYIINNIPIHTWKLVRRRGSHVSVLSAREIPALQEASHHDAFDRLLNLPEFEEGVE
ncbi:MAG TPA: AAA family ATPase, partial [Candidatus Nanopelagicales bacterium]|nr:AAA family ATPase [Candidatus Nanopelagicales bacterium]